MPEMIGPAKIRSSLSRNNSKPRIFQHLHQGIYLMGNKIVTEADRKASPRPATPNGVTLPTPGRGQRSSLERGVATRSKKNPGKRPHQG
jgi:hypothetical protein